MPSRFADPLGASEGKFSLRTEKKTGRVGIFYELPSRVYSEAKELADLEDLKDAGTDLDKRTPIKLLEVSVKKDVLAIIPRTTFPGVSFLEPKYGRIKVIFLEGFNFAYPRRADEVEYLLQELPKGFVKDPEFGLGLLKDYRYIIDAVETIPDVKHLCISRSRKTALQGDTYILNFNQFDGVRRAIDNAHRKALNGAMVEKRVLTHNSLLYGIDSKTYPEQKLTYPEGTIRKVFENNSGGQFSEKDQVAALTVVQDSRRSLGKSHPEKLLQLQREIDLVTLEDLIEKIQSRLGKHLSEAIWQSFFLECPFVLSLTFALPIVVMEGQVSVGGRDFLGKGDKITDFLAKNNLTDNITLIEIKTPQTKLLGKQYRSKAYPASKDLVGSVTQVLDQRYKLQTEINQLKANSRRWDLETYAVRGLAIIGMTPNAPEEKKSFELFRNNLHDVFVVTFDELLEKLRHLHAFLSADERTKPTEPTLRSGTDEADKSPSKAETPNEKSTKTMLKQGDSRK